MKKRLVAALVAVALAVIGVVLLINYANGADERAYDGAKLQDVLQVTAPIPADTNVSELADKVETVQLPRSAIANGAVTSLDELEGLSTTTQLEAGEQVLKARFSREGADTPKAAAKANMPPGTQEITIPLGSARAVGDVLKVGDKVGIIGSYRTKEGDGRTQFIRNQVPITKIIGPGVKWDGTNVDDVTQMVTVAVKTRDAGKIVNALEFGKLWLTKQYPDTERGQGGSISRDDVTE